MPSRRVAGSALWSSTWLGRAVFGRLLGRLGTRRAALLALVVCALALSVAAPLRTYLTQRAELQTQLQQQQSLRTQEAQLEQRQQQLSDPAAAEAEIRTRLRYMLPGETPYVVQLPGDGQQFGQGGASSSGTDNSGKPWYEQMWNSVAGQHG